MKMLFSVMFTGFALIAADPAENLVFKQDFENGIDQFVKAPAGVKYFAKVKPEVVEGKVKGTKAVRFGEKMDCMIQRMKMPVPGNISMWVKTEDKVVGKGVYRRFAATSYSGTGYFGYQEYATYSLLFVHNFNKKNTNIGLGPLPVGKWNHLSLNFSDKHVDIYVNGEKKKSADLPESISKVSGNLVYGSNGITVDSIEVYNRILSDEEVKSLMK